MADGVELAPLRGKIILDISDFNEAEEQLASNVDNLTSKITESFQTLGEQVGTLREKLEKPIDVQVDVKSGNNTENLSEQTEQTEALTEATDELQESFVNLDLATSIAEDAMIRLNTENNSLSEEMQLSYSTTEEYSSEIKALADALYSVSMQARKFGIDTSEANEALQMSIPLWDDLTEAQQESFQALGENEYNLQAYDTIMQDLSNALGNLNDKLEETGPAFENTSNVTSEATENLAQYNQEAMEFVENSTQQKETVLSGKEAMQQYIATLQKVLAKFRDADASVTDLKGLWSQLNETQRAGVPEFITDTDAVISNLERLKTAFHDLAVSGNLDDETLINFSESMDNVEDSGNTLIATLVREQEAFEASKTCAAESANMWNSATESIETDNEEVADSSMSTTQHFHDLGLQIFLYGQMLGYTAKRFVDSALVQSASVATATREYGKYAQGVIQWSNNSAEAMGQSKGEALSLANQLALSLKSYGANSKDAAKYAERLATMAAQLSVATGGSVKYTQAADAFRSALGGQMFSLESLGITVTKTQLNQDALNSSWHKAYKKLSAYQQKVVITNAIQHALNKTFGSTKEIMQTQYGQWETLNAKFKNISAEIGTRLLPLFIKLGNKILDLCNWFEKLSPSTKHVIEDIGKVVLSIGGLLVAFALLHTAGTKLKEAFNLLKGVFINTNGAVRLLWKPFVGLIKIIGNLAKKILGSLVNAFKKIGSLALNVSKKLGVTLVNGFKKAITGAGNLLKSLGNLIIKGFNKAIEGSGKLAKALADITIKGFNKVMNGSKIALTALSRLITQGFNKVILGSKKTVSVLADLASNGFEKVMSGSNKLKTALISLVTNGCEKVISGSSKLKSVLIDLASNGLAKALSATKTLGGAFLDFLPELGGLIVAFGPLILVIGGVVTAVALLYEAWQHNWFGIRQVVANALNFIENIISDVLQVIGNIFSTELAFWVDIFTGHFGAAINVVENACSSIKNIVGNLASDMLNAGANMMNSLVQGIEDGAGGVLSAMGNVISSLWSEVWGSGSSSSTHGSHYNGLDFVPFDGYSATLHKGEMVLTAEQAENYRTGGSALNNNMEIHLHSPESIDPLEAYNRMEELSRNLANGFY